MGCECRQNWGDLHNSFGVNVESFVFHTATDESLDMWRSSPTLLTFFFNLGNNS